MQRIMYIGIKDNKVKFYSKQPIDTNMYVVDEVRETYDEYMLSDDGTEYIIYDENVIKRRKLENELKSKEHEYNMSRWQHEYVVANPESFPEFILNRAQELEDLAEELRREDGDSQEDSGESL